MKFASDISGPIHAISFEFHVFVYDLIAKRKLIKKKTFVYHTPPETGAYYFQAERERKTYSVTYDSLLRLKRHHQSVFVKYRSMKKFRVLPCHDRVREGLFFASFFLFYLQD